MNTQKFKNNGHNKFPISTETLDFMQEQIKLVYGLASLAGQNIIIRMPSANTPGLVIINGELLPLTGSANTYITIIESSSSITFSGETISGARTTRTAQFTSYSAGANSIAFTSVVSMRTNRQLQLDLASAGQHHTPKGTVIDWYGEASCDNIPYGWVPCGGFFKTSGGVYQGQGSIPAAITTEKNKWLARYPGATITEQFHYGPNNTYLKITNIPDFGAIPNLSHRFIVGAGYDGNSGAYDLSATGGADSVTLTAAQSGLPAHSHTITDLQGSSTSSFAHWGDGDGSVAGAGNGRLDTVQIQSNGSTDNNSESSAAQSHENRPPYYALYKLIKVI